MAHVICGILGHHWDIEVAEWERKIMGFHGLLRDAHLHISFFRFSHENGEGALVKTGNAREYLRISWAFSVFKHVQTRGFWSTLHLDRPA